MGQFKEAQERPQKTVLALAKAVFCIPASNSVQMHPVHPRALLRS